MNKGKGWFLALAFMIPALVPAPALSQQTTGQTGANGIPVRTSWTSDRHSVRVGDVVTILIDEYTLASSNLTDVASNEKDRDLGLASGAGMGSGFRTQNDVQSRTRGEASRTERFAAEVSARVLEITPSGMIRLEGKKKLQIDKHEQEVTIRGWLRTQDLSTQNTVESWRIADAEILYSSNGELGKAGGFWSKILDIIWP